MATGSGEVVVIVGGAARTGSDSVAVAFCGVVSVSVTSTGTLSVVPAAETGGVPDSTPPALSESQAGSVFPARTDQV